MSGQTKRIASGFTPFFPEITYKLRDEVSSYLARWVYQCLAVCFYVQENWDTDTRWVEASIKATKEEIRQKSGARSVDGFYKAWRQLLEAGFVLDNKDGTLTLPWFKKKEYQYLSPRQIEERLTNLEKLVEQNGDGGDPKKSGQIAQDPTDPSVKQRDPSAQRRTSSVKQTRNDPDILLKGLKKKENRIEGVNEGPVSIVDLPTAEDVPNLLDTVQKNLVLNLWPGYNPLTKDEDKDAIEYICKFSAADVHEGFSAAQKEKIKRGNFGWIIERLEKPEIYREDRGNGNGRTRKKQDSGSSGRSSSQGAAGSHRAGTRPGSRGRTDSVEESKWPEIKQ